MSTRYIPIYKVTLVRESGIPAPQEEVITPAIAARIAASYLEGADREHFVAMMLDGRNHVIGINTVSVGALSAAIVHPREVFKPAILANASSIILVHNHPSGDPRPSPEDVELFSRMKEAGRLLGIQVHDAIIIGLDEHYSWSSARNFTLSE
jgi:DNA repair protein RadC